MFASPRRIARVAATAIAIILLGAPAAASAAVPTAIDPRCTATFGLVPNLTVSDPVDAPAGLPPQVTIDDMSCFIIIAGGAAGVSNNGYVYLDDSFARFLSMTAALADAGWTFQESPQDSASPDDLFPVDLSALAGREAEGELALVGQLGEGQIGDPTLNGISLVWATETSDFFGAGLFVFALPLVGVPEEVPVTGPPGFDDPSTISNLRTIANAVPSPGQGAVLVISAGLLTLLLAIPAFLLSKVLQSRYQQWFGWLERGRVGRVRKQLAEPAGTGRRWIFLAVGMVLAAFIAGFVDPRFGFNGLSVRLFLTLLATFALFNVGARAVVMLVLKRAQPDARRSRPSTGHPARGGDRRAPVATAAVRPRVIFGLVAARCSRSPSHARSRRW